MHEMDGTRYITYRALGRRALGEISRARIEQWRSWLQFMASPACSDQQQPVAHGPLGIMNGVYSVVSASGIPGLDYQLYQSEAESNCNTPARRQCPGAVCSWRYCLHSWAVPRKDIDAGHHLTYTMNQLF